VPAGGGDLTFWTSYDTEADWDFLAVEARTAGGNDWTTLPDANDHTSQNTGQSCLALNSGGWRTLHPHLDHYQTQAGDASCTPTGSTGAWNAASGSSNGWQQWWIDLDKWAGQTVEISIAYISDWGTQNLGVFLDDFAWPGGSTSFEGTDTGGWQISGPPAGSGANANNFEITDAGGFPVWFVDHDPEVAAVRLRVRGHLHPGAAQRGDGQGGRLPAPSLTQCVQPRFRRFRRHLAGALTPAALMQSPRGAIGQASTYSWHASKSRDGGRVGRWVVTRARSARRAAAGRAASASTTPMCRAAAASPAGAPAARAQHRASPRRRESRPSPSAGAGRSRRT
jgi:immune inhibitor InhA-like protein